MHPSVFNYLQPTDAQVDQMSRVRAAAVDLAQTLEEVVPDGPDRTYVLRTLRTVIMWANVAITRQPDGSPR